MFDGFYYNKYANIKILDEAFPSVKSESTKQNKSMNAQTSQAGFTSSIPTSNKKTLDIKSSLSR